MTLNMFTKRTLNTDVKTFQENHLKLTKTFWYAIIQYEYSFDWCHYSVCTFFINPLILNIIKMYVVSIVIRRTFC